MSGTPEPKVSVAFQLDGQEDDELQEDHYELGRRLGRGSFATVYVARHRLTDKRMVVKKLDRIQPHQAEQVMHEIDMMKRAGGHPNLVSYKGHYYTKDKVLCIVLGYCEGGTLADLLKNIDSGVNLTEEQIMGWFIQLCMAVSHLHERNIIHRDLKPGNIFFNKTHTVIRVGDLGIAKSMSNSVEMATTMMGTPYYMSPELMANRPYSTKSDIWSLGCILYEMAARKTAFEAKGMPQLIMKIMRNAYQPLPSYLSRQFTSLVGSLLRSDPEMRPTASQLLQLSFVRLHAERQLEQPINPQIDIALATLVASPMDAGAERSVMRPHTATSMHTTAGTRPKTSKSKTGSKPVMKGKSFRSSKGVARLGRTQNPNLQTVKVANHKVANEWDAGAQYEQRQAQMREMRHQAREMEQRMARENARQRRKATDPRERAKEERKERQLRAMVKEQQRRKIAEQEAAILRSIVGEEASLEGPAAAFRKCDKLGRTMPGMPSVDGSLDEGEGHEDDEGAVQQVSLAICKGEDGSPPTLAAVAPPTAAAMRIRNYIDDQVEVADEAVPDDDTFAAYEDLDDDYDTDGEDDDDESEAGDESQDVEHDDEGDDTEQESEEVMENKLAEVWETNPTERMHLLERMWQHSMHKRGVDRSLLGDDAKEPSALSDPNQLLGNLDTFFSGGLDASGPTPEPAHSPGVRLPAEGPCGSIHAPKELPPLKGSSMRGSITAADDMRSRDQDVAALRATPKSPLKTISRPGSVDDAGGRARHSLDYRGQRHHSHDSAGIPVHERDLAELKLTDLASALQPTDDDPLLKAAHLRRILTNKPRDASSSYPSPVGTPSAHVSPQLAPIHKQGRLPTGSSLWSGNTNLPSPSTSPISQASQGKHHGVYVRQPVALDACETTVTFAVTPQNKVSKNLGNAVRGLSDYSSSKHRRKKNMAGSFMQAMAVASVRNLEQDSLLEPDEDPEQLGNRLLDPTMPEKMMELEQKQRSLAGVPLYQPGWNPEPKEDDPNPSPKAHRELPKLREKSRRHVQIVEPPLRTSPKTEDVPADDEALMLTAVQDQMREIRRWRDTLVSGRQSHELAALELMDRAATINSFGTRSSTNSLRSTMQTPAADDSENSDDEVINL